MTLGGRLRLTCGRADANAARPEMPPRGTSSRKLEEMMRSRGGTSVERRQ